MAATKKAPPPYSSSCGVAAATPAQPSRSNMAGDSTMSAPGGGGEMAGGARGGHRGIGGRRGVCCRSAGSFPGADLPSAPSTLARAPVTTPCHVDTSPRNAVKAAGVGYSCRMWLFPVGRPGEAGRVGGGAGLTAAVLCWAGGAVRLRWWWGSQANSMSEEHSPCAMLMTTRQRMGTLEASVLRGGRVGQGVGQGPGCEGGCGLGCGL
jgi:hypothetical protein